MGSIVRARLIVRGRVQGVFYRQNTKDKAGALSLVGWVKNQSDGTVLVDVTGPAEKVDELISWCRQGPRSAKVDNVDVEWLDVDPASTNSRFEIVG